MKNLAILLACLLSGCAGIATYSIRPFYDQQTQHYVCCETLIVNGKDIASIVVDVAKTGENYTIHLQESGVGATAPVTAQGEVVSTVAKSVSDAAISAAKFIK